MKIGYSDCLTNQLHKIFVIKKESIYKVFLNILFFFFGFGYSRISLPAAMLFLLIYFKNYIKFNKVFIIFLYLNLIFIITLFLIGSANMTLSNPTRSFIGLFASTIVIAIISYKNAKYSEHLIFYYALGLFILTMAIVGYSYFENPLLYGRGKLIDPFTMTENNSPGYSNNLAIVFIVFFNHYFFSQNIVSKLIASVIMAISLLGAIFLAGRTFFLITGLFLIIYFFTMFSKKNLLQLLISVLIISLTISYFYEDIESYTKITIGRLSTGVESDRFLHWEDAMPKVLTHPMGGFKVNQRIEHTSWLHNLWLDTARTGGWIPLFALLASNLVVIYFLVKSIKKDKYFFILLLMVFMSLLIMFQDVVIEGNWNILFFYFMIVSILIAKIKIQLNT